MDAEMSLFDEEFAMNDPMNHLARAPSDDNLDFPPPGQTSTGSTTACANTITKNNIDSFSSHLDSLHNRVRDMICDAPSGDQGSMVSTFATWARSIASKPMEEPNVASIFRSGTGDKKTPAILATKKAKANETPQK